MSERQRSVMELKDRIRRDDYRVDPEAVAAAIVARIVSRAGARGQASEHVLEACELGLEPVEAHAA